MQTIQRTDNYSGTVTVVLLPSNDCNHSFFVCETIVPTERIQYINDHDDGGVSVRGTAIEKIIDVLLGDGELPCAFSCYQRSTADLRDYKRKIRK